MSALSPSIPYHIFISRVSGEFGKVSDALAADLRKKGMIGKLQVDFRQELDAETTLDKLEKYVREADAVIALIGQRSGSYPPIVAARKWAHVLPAGIERATYTQWEVHFARHHGRSVSFYFGHDHGKATSHYPPEAPPDDSDDLEGQETYALWLTKTLGVDRGYFRTEDKLCRLVLQQPWPIEVISSTGTTLHPAGHDSVSQPPLQHGSDNLPAEQELQPPENNLIFISYAHDRANSKETGEFVRKLHEDLKGIYKLSPLVDVVDNPPGASISDFCTETPKRCRWVICVCTPEYLEKSRSRSRHRLRDEFTAVMERDRLTGRDSTIPILLRGSAEQSIPDGLKDKVRVDFQAQKSYSDALAELAAHLIAGKEIPGNPSPPWDTIDATSYLILAADVDGFSEMLESERHHVMSQVWAALGEVGGKPPPWQAAFPILDGFGIIWSNLTAHRKALECAKALIGKIRNVDNVPALRCGLHQGLVASSPMLDGQPNHFYGAGINDAGRCCGLGDAGDIIMTDAFWRSAKNLGIRGWNEIHRVWPDEDSPDGVLVFAHRGDAGRLRVLQASDHQESIPSRLILRNRAQEHFRDLLGNLALDFAELLESQYGVEIDCSKMRVTFWYPAEVGASKLFYSGIRVKGVWTEDDEELEAESDTGEETGGFWDFVACEESSKMRYSIAGRGEGPPGIAWLGIVEGRACVAHNLPSVTPGDPESQKSYDDHLSEFFHMSPQSLQKMSRRANFIGACGFPLPHVKHPLGVVCLDLDVQLPDTATRSELEESLADIMRAYSTGLLLAWSFKT